MLDPNAVAGHWHRVFDPLRTRVGDLFGKTLTHVYSVSWEGAFPTWTPSFEEGFQAVTGYGIRPYLPCLAGFDTTATVPRRDASFGQEAFVRDFRRVRNELFRDRFYGKIRDLAREAGLKLYSESGGPWHRHPEGFLYADQIRSYAVNDMPQGEFWYAGAGVPSHLHGVRGAVSAAHVHGLRRASAEAFTHMVSHWSPVPSGLKRIGDDALVDGVNHLVWHTFTCSPAKFGIPGHEYFAGTHINRNVTWHKELAAYVKYIGRCQWMLQQGLPVADYAVWAGASPYQGWGRYREKPYDKSSLRLPPSFVYDVMNTDVLMTRVAVRDGKLVLPDGMTYGALVIDPENAADLTPAVEARLAALRKAGARIVERDDAAGYLAALTPDFDAAKPYFATHRRIGDDDVYFVTGEGLREVKFKVRDKVAELWDPETGLRRAAEIRETVDGRSALVLDLSRDGSAFVVFRTAHGKLDAVERPGGRVLDVKGPWQASFAYHPGVKAQPPKARILQLGDFSKDQDFEVSHFSGSVTYKAEFACMAEDVAPATLSLGKVVGGVVTVRVNGSDLGVVWKDPWKVRIPPSVLKKGSNVLEVRLVNAWKNRLIGDCAVPAAQRVTSSNLAYHTRGRKGGKPTVWSGYDAGDWLTPNGLIGPVTICPDRRSASEVLPPFQRRKPRFSAAIKKR